MSDSKICNYDISQIQLKPPTINCRDYNNIEAWKKFVDDFRTFTTSKNFLQILIQCSCLNGPQCMIKNQCPNLKENPLAVYTDSTCRECIFSGDSACTKFQEDMKKVAGVIMAYQTAKSNNTTSPEKMSREESLRFLVNTINFYCGTNITVPDIDSPTAEDIIQQLLQIIGFTTNNNNNNNNTTDKSSGLSKNIIWIIVSACLFFILILVGIFYWHKSKKGGLSRQIKQNIISGTSRGINVSDQLATLGGDNLIA